MLKEVVSALSDKRIINNKRPSKETLNHTGIIYLASGIDPFENTPQAYLEAYRSLGIDLIKQVPASNVVRRLKPGESTQHNEYYKRAYLGLYDTYFRQVYPFETVEEFFAAERIELNYRDMIVPVPHRFDLDLIAEKQRMLGDVGLYYYQYYNTFFMWGVEYLGWEVFMMAAVLEPERFNEKFLDIAFETSLKDITTLSEAETPYVFLHDDLAMKNGPVFAPDWYDEYIFPRYPELWKPAKDKGKQIIFVADGDMGLFLEKLKSSGVDGVHLENPATSMERILEVFGDGIIICGMDTRLLTFGTSEEVRSEVDRVAKMTRDIPGFVLCSPGGLHDNIPLENLEAYFDARVEHGFTPKGWRKGTRAHALELMHRA